ncbi:MAG: AAA family ATPase [Candidatus Sericytochromatia bacterium]
MIDKISFENYKVFKDLQELELRKITVLIGKNSSGKSAVARLPTLIENSLSGTFSEPLILNNNGIKLGTLFRDLLYARKSTGTLYISIKDEKEELNINIASGIGTKDFPKIARWSLSKNNQVYLRYADHVFKGFIPTLDNPIESLILKTEFIDSIRVTPERGYEIPTSIEIKKIGITGENTYNILLKDFIDEKSTLLNKISDWYKNNFDGWGLRVNEELKPFYQFELTKDDLNINIKDVGQGMTQVLPLVTIALMPTKEETLIIIEEPELHLHPAVHGNLAELFVDSLNDTNKKYLIETHSQNFVLRLRRLVAEGKISKDNLIIYFVDFDEEESKSDLKRINITDSGDVDYWPEDIFSETLKEALAIRKAQKGKGFYDS